MSLDAALWWEEAMSFADLLRVGCLYWQDLTMQIVASRSEGVLALSLVR